MDTKDYIGKDIYTVIDRPLGSKHPKYGYIYPINAGYVPDTRMPDGEELDVYILGVGEPLESFTGECIAIIHRTNDDDDKLIIVPEGKTFTDAEIEKMVEFQEKYFKHILIR
jgi:inorganic pyrophosphatase